MSSLSPPIKRRKRFVGEHLSGRKRQRFFGLFCLKVGAPAPRPARCCNYAPKEDARRFSCPGDEACHPNLATLLPVSRSSALPEGTGTDYSLCAVGWSFRAVAPHLRATATIPCASVRSSRTLVPNTRAVAKFSGATVKLSRATAKFFRAVARKVRAIAPEPLFLYRTRIGDQKPLGMSPRSRASRSS